MARRKKTTDKLAPNGQETPDSPPDPVRQPTGKRRAVRVYLGELCPEWERLPRAQQTFLVNAALRLGIRDIQRSPDLQCALGVTASGFEEITGLGYEESREEESETNNFVLDLGG